MIVGLSELLTRLDLTDNYHLRVRSNFAVTEPFFENAQ